MAADKNKIHCTGCKKVIGELDYLNDGKFTIKCPKCGVLNTIEAATKEIPVSKVTLNGHHSGLVLGTFSMQHISTDNPEVKVKSLSSDQTQ